MNKLIQALSNNTYTLNGAYSNKSTLNAVVNLFSSAVSSNLQSKKDLIVKAMLENPINAIKTVLYIRDVRNGQGNKDILRVFHEVCASLESHVEFFDAYLKIIKHIPEFGSWNDVYTLYSTTKSQQVKDTIIKLVNENLHNKQDALCAKWFPMQSQFHKDYAKALELDLGQVRRYVTAIRRTTEQLMCRNEWSSINYDHVPSRTNKLCSAAFLKHDNARRSEYLAEATKENSTVSMKASTLYPHEITNMVRKGQAQSGNALWNSLPDYMEGSDKFNILPIIDVSGSMSCGVPGTSCQAIDIAVGLGLYFSSHNQGDFKNAWLNFSTNPQFQLLRGNTLSEQIRNMNTRDWEMSTNLQAVFDLILSVDCKPEDMPKVLIIVSDMEFNCTNSTRTNFKAIDDKYKAKGLTRPLIVFWRVNVVSTQFPVTVNDQGSILINGYSPGIMKLILSMGIEDLTSITPESFMLKAIANKYEFVDEYFKF